MRAIFIITAFVLTFAGVEVFRRWSLRREILDVPNERSSHRAPTPRGGGLVIAAVCLLFYSVEAIFLSEKFAPGYFIGAIIIAGISWLDDLKSISPLPRLLVHAAAAGLIVFSPAGSWQEIYLPFFGAVKLGVFGQFLTFLWVVWLTNAYNFMDGIDGLAAAQSVIAGFGWLLLGQINGADGAGFFGAILAASSFGFLLHNWQPARIFMGDVGSAFLGYTFAAMPLLFLNETSSSAFGEAGLNAPKTEAIVNSAAILFVWLFVFDTVYTFFRRLRRGEKVWLAHRSHLYQKMNANGYSHRFVSTVYSVLSAIIVIAVLSWIYTNGTSEWIVGTLVAAIGLGLVIFSRFGKIVDAN